MGAIQFLTPTESRAGSTANVFDLLPSPLFGYYYRNGLGYLPTIASFSKPIEFHLATYTGPYSASDCQPPIQPRGRWSQIALSGLTPAYEIERQIIEDGEDIPDLSSRLLTPGLAFEGEIVHEDQRVGVHGMLGDINAKSQRRGWIELVLDGEPPMRTIADLKARIGKISLEEAAEHNKNFQNGRPYQVRGVELR